MRVAIQPHDDPNNRTRLQQITEYWFDNGKLRGSAHWSSINMRSKVHADDDIVFVGPTLTPEQVEIRLTVRTSAR